jgi:hypothetical protein
MKPVLLAGWKSNSPVVSYGTLKSYFTSLTLGPVLLVSKGDENEYPQGIGYPQRDVLNMT